MWGTGRGKYPVEEHYTGRHIKHNKKYYIYCKSCGLQWVDTLCYACHQRFTKHVEGYLRKEKDSLWNIVCPHCEAGL